MVFEKEKTVSPVSFISVPVGITADESNKHVFQK